MSKILVTFELRNLNNNKDMRDIKLYECGLATTWDNEPLGKCSVPDFDRIEDMLNHGFISEDIQEDQFGRFILVNSVEYGF